MHHYVYELRDHQNSMSYIGVRSCRCLPEDDARYLSSSKSVRQAAARGIVFEKIILGRFRTRSAAVAAEVWLHDVFDVDLNPRFYNQAKQPSTYSQLHVGVKQSPETREKHRRAILRQNRNGHRHPMWGKHHTEESKAKTSAKLKGRPKSPETRERQRLCQANGNGHFRGHRHTEKNKQRIAESLRLAYQDGRRSLTGAALAAQRMRSQRERVDA